MLYSDIELFLNDIHQAMYFPNHCNLLASSDWLYFLDINISSYKCPGLTGLFPSLISASGHLSPPPAHVGIESPSSRTARLVPPSTRDPCGYLLPVGDWAENILI